MSQVGSRKKPCSSGRLAGFAAENMLLSECRMTAAACGRLATNSERDPHTGSLTAAPRIPRGAASGRIPQTSFQERYA